MNTHMAADNNQTIESDSVIVEQTYNASVNHVWKAMTNREEMQKCYFQLSDFKPEVGFEVEFEAGDEIRKYLYHWKVLKVATLKKIKYSWTYPEIQGYSELMTEIKSTGEKSTDLKLTHTGFDSFLIYRISERKASRAAGITSFINHW